MEVDIKKAVLQHFEDIGQDFHTHDVTFENAQARERTQVIMDIANQKAVWSSEQGICLSWHLDGLLIMATICPCME